MINKSYFILNVLCLAGGTIFIRGFFIALSSKLRVNDGMRELFTYIPAAIIPGLVIPVTFYHKGVVEYLHGKERFYIILASIFLGFFIRNTLAVIGFGLIVLYLFTNA